MAAFSDHFSSHAQDYAQNRPSYPTELFAALAERAPDRGLAWDVGTGNGQVARALAPHFERVVATDASAEQLRHARAQPGVEYRCVTAEVSGLEAGSVSLIVCAASLHWFDLERFYTEVRRVARPQALLVAFSYWCNPQVGPGIDEVVIDLAERVLEPDWPPQIRHPRSGYRDLPFPFAPEPPPECVLQMQWTASTLLGWLGTWSAVRPHLERTGVHPVAAIADQIYGAWPEPEGGPTTVRLPLFFRMGRVG